RLTDAHLDALLDVLPPLNILRLQEQRLTDAGAARIGTLDWPLQHLDLSGSDIGDEGLAALLAGSLPSTLRQLRLNRCGLKSKAGKPLAEAPFVHLDVLQLQDNHLNRKAAEQLAASPHLRGLYRFRRGGEGWGWDYALNIVGNPVGAAGRSALEKL